MGMVQSELLLRVGPGTPEGLSSECMLVCMLGGSVQVVPASPDHMLANSTLNALSL